MLRRRIAVPAFPENIQMFPLLRSVCSAPGSRVTSAHLESPEDPGAAVPKRKERVDTTIAGRQQSTVHDTEPRGVHISPNFKELLWVSFGFQSILCIRIWVGIALGKFWGAVSLLPSSFHFF